MQARDENIIPITRAEKVPPVAIDEEEALIACILSNPGDGMSVAAIDLVADRLKPEHFYTGQFRAMYEACLRLHRSQRPTDLMGVSRALADAGELERVGGRSALASLLDRFELAPRAEYYADVLIDKFRRRQAIALSHQIKESAHSSAEWTQIWSEIESRLLELNAASRGQEMRTFSSVLVEVCGEIEQASTRGVPPGIPSGFYDLDTLTQNLNPGLVIVGGRPSMGKTAFAGTIARNILVESHRPVIFYTIEMADRQVLKRLLASEAGIDLNRLKAGTIGNDDWGRLYDGVATLSAHDEAPSFINDPKAPVTVSGIQSFARRTKARYGDLGAIVIDYLQLMQTPGRNRITELGDITRSLKNLSLELECPIILLSQLSREVESRPNKRPMMCDLRESGQIEQDADLIMMLYRDEYYNPDTTQRGITEVIVAKNRDGEVGTVELLFDPSKCRFRNKARR